MKHIHTFESFLNEGKMSLNKTIPSSTKEYTWVYQIGKDSSKTATEISKKLNDLGILSFVSKTTGDTVAIPTKDIQVAFDKVLSDYDNLKQFAYSDGTKLNKNVVNEGAKKYSVEDFNTGDIVHFKDDEAWIVVQPGMRASNSRRQSDEITLKPYNKVAKDRNVSLPSDFTIDYINTNVSKVEKK